MTTENIEFFDHVPVTASACLSPAVTLMTGSLKDYRKRRVTYTNYF